MPQVPTYGGPQVAADPLRPAQARALDVSSGTRAIGQGLATLGEGIDRYQEREAQAQAFNAEDLLTTKWLKWDSWARKYYVGEKAADYEPAAREFWSKAPETFGSALNPRARELVGRSLAQKRNSAMASVMAAASAEQERHADSVATADINSTLQFGVTTGNLDVARQQIGEKVAALGARKGWSTEEVTAAAGKYISSLHVAAIDAMPAEQGLVYFKQHRDEIDFDLQGRMEKTLERSIEIEQKQREADAEKAARDAEEKLANSAWSLFAQNKPVPPSVIAAMGREGVQLANAIENRAAREASGKTVVTDMGVYLDLRDAIGRNEFVDLRKFEDVISPSDLKTLREKLDQSDQEGFFTDEERKNKALLDLGIDKKTQGKAAYAVLGLIDRRTREASSGKGNKPLTPDEKQAVIDSVVMDRVYVNEWGTDPEKLAPLLTPDEAADAYVMVNDKAVKLSVVPADKRMAIISARRARGLPVTEQAIVETYLRKYPNGQ